MAPTKGDLTATEQKLIESINSGKVEEVKVLITEPDVRIDCLDKTGMTLLQHAAYRGNSELCDLLLAHGADINSNYHEHGYTALMFGALTGNKKVTRQLLQAGANIRHTNSVGRTAAQMAGFVGQHQVVSLINNFFPKEDLAYFTVPRGLETEPKLSQLLVVPLFTLINLNNLNPVKISLYLQKRPELLDESYKVAKVLEILLERNMKAHDTNEVMAMKFHYLMTLVRHVDKSRQQNNKKLDVWMKNLLRGRDSDGFAEAPERMIRAMLKAFPFADSQLLHQMVRSLADVEIGKDPTALNILNQSINGQRFGSEDDKICGTCEEFNVDKKCSVCKMVNYCNQECQKLHWFTHKKFCKKLAEEYKVLQKWKEQKAEQERKEEEERKKAEEEEKKKAEEEEEKKKSAEEEEEKKKSAEEEEEKKKSIEEQEEKKKSIEEQEEKKDNLGEQQKAEEEGQNICVTNGDEVTGLELPAERALSMSDVKLALDEDEEFGGSEVNS